MSGTSQHIENSSTDDMVYIYRMSFRVCLQCCLLCEQNWIYVVGIRLADLVCTSLCLNC